MRVRVEETLFSRFEGVTSPEKKPKMNTTKPNCIYIATEPSLSLIVSLWII